MDYLRAVLNGHKENEARYLKRLITLGSKLNQNTTKYESELKKLHIKQPVKEKTNPIEKVKMSKSYDISSIYTKENSIIINFNRVATKSDIDFFE